MERISSARSTADSGETDLPDAEIDCAAAESGREGGGRVVWGVVLAVVAPGAGLVVLRRDRLGIAAAVVWSVLATAAACRIVLSGDAPGAAWFALLLSAIAVWVVQFGMTVSIARRYFGRRGRERAAMLLAKADACLLDDRLAEAEGHLRGALAVDDENPLHWRRLAELMTLLGKFDASIEGHERVIDLDVLGEHRRDSILAIEKLRAVAGDRGGSR